MARAAGFREHDLALAFGEAAALLLAHLPGTMRAGDAESPLCMLTIRL